MFADQRYWRKHYVASRLKDRLSEFYDCRKGAVDPTLDANNTHCNTSVNLRLKNSLTKNTGNVNEQSKSRYHDARSHQQYPSGILQQSLL
jgi:hypothetical protein